MTSEQVMSKFKEKGIEVTVYKDDIRGILDCIVDTTKHDRQVRADAIDEFRIRLIDYVVNEKSKGNEPYWAVAIREVAKQLKEGE